MGGLIKSIIGMFMPGNLMATAIVIGVVALTSAGTATFVTANYYNNKIINASTSAAAAAYAKGVSAQQEADRKMTDARLADQKARDDREKASALADQRAEDYLKLHRPADIKACRMPKEVAHAINQVLQ